MREESFRISWRLKSSSSKIWNVSLKAIDQSRNELNKKPNLLENKIWRIKKAPICQNKGEKWERQNYRINELQLEDFLIERLVVRLFFNETPSLWKKVGYFQKNIQAGGKILIDRYRQTIRDFSSKTIWGLFEV